MKVGLACALIACGPLLTACERAVQEVVEIDRPAPPDGPVVDTAGLIPAEAEATLDRRLRDYWDEEATAIVVETTDSLGGRTIEEYARDEFNGWGIGDSDTNRGILLVVAPNEMKARIEVGCGLESVVTDSIAKQIMETDMVPRFRTGAYKTGITEGVSALIKAIESSDVMPGPVSPYCVSLMRDAA